MDRPRRIEGRPRRRLPLPARRGAANAVGVPQPRPIAFLDARLIDPDRLEDSRGGALVVDGRRNLAAFFPSNSDS